MIKGAEPFSAKQKHTKENNKRIPLHYHCFDSEAVFCVEILTNLDFCLYPEVSVILIFLCKHCNTPFLVRTPKSFCAIYVILLLLSLLGLLLAIFLCRNSAVLFEEIRKRIR